MFKLFFYNVDKTSNEKQDMAVNAIALLQRQRQLIEIERDCEREEFKRLKQARGIEQNIERGTCHYPLRLGRSYYNSLNQLVVEVYYSTDTAGAVHDNDDDDLPDDSGFDPGKQVIFFGVSGIDDVNYLPFTATISIAEQGRLVVAVDDPQHITRLHSVERLGVQLSIDERTYRLMLEALDRVINAPGAWPSYATNSTIALNSSGSRSLRSPFRGSTAGRSTP